MNVDNTNYSAYATTYNIYNLWHMDPTSCQFQSTIKSLLFKAQEIHLVMEYMAGGELYDRLFQQRVYKEENIQPHGDPLIFFTPQGVYFGESKRNGQCPKGPFRNEFKARNQS